MVVTSNRAQIENQGQVKSMQLPEDWVERAAQVHAPHAFLREFKCPDNELVT